MKWSKAEGPSGIIICPCNINGWAHTEKGKLNYSTMGMLNSTMMLFWSKAAQPTCSKSEKCQHLRNMQHNQHCIYMLPKRKTDTLQAQTILLLLLCTNHFLNRMFIDSSNSLVPRWCLECHNRYPRFKVMIFPVKVWTYLSWYHRFQYEVQRNTNNWPTTFVGTIFT